MEQTPGLSSRKEHGKTLHDAAKSGDGDTVTRILERLRENGLLSERNAQDSQGCTPLHAAAKNNRADIVRILLAYELDTDALDNDGRTSLHLAASKGYDDVIICLLDADAAPDILDKNIQAPLHRASEWGRGRAVDLLLPRSSRLLNWKDKTGRTPLFCAVQREHKAVSEALKLAGADVEAADEGKTILYRMAVMGRAAAVSMMIGLGAKLNATDMNGRTPLYAAAQMGHKDVCFVLRGDRADDTVVDFSGNTLFHRAVTDESEIAARLLHEVGLSMEKRNGEEQTPLYVAAHSNLRNMAQLLIELGADIESPDGNQQTLLHYAARKGHDAAARILCDFGATKEALDKEERTPLYVAAELNRKSTVKALAEKGADTNARDSNGNTLLHRSAHEGNKKATILLLLMEAERDERNGQGRTPLHVAATHSIEVVRALLEFEPDCDALDDNKQTPLRVAIDNEKFEIVKLLIEYMVGVETSDQNRQTLLHAAAIHGDLDILTWLLQQEDVKESKDGPDENGQTALHLAAQHNHPDAVKLLIDNGLDYEAQDTNGWTPLHIAAEHGHVDVIRELLARSIPANRTAKDKLERYPLDLAKARGNHKAAKLLQLDPKETKSPVPETVGEYTADLRKFTTDNLKGVLDANDPVIKALAQKAVANVANVCEKFGLEEEYRPGLVKLMLYDFVILCDDSSSMQSPYERIVTLKITLQRIVEIAMSMDLDDSGISLRFLNYAMDSMGAFDNMVDPQVIATKVSEVIEGGGITILGGRLLSKIVRPMIYEKINQRKFQKPIMVVVITDGEPCGESRGSLKETIMGCKQFLDAQSYGPGSTIFLISQVGDSSSATTFLKSIEQDPMIHDMVYCSPERLDDMMKTLGGRQDSQAYTAKLVKLFLAALGRQSK